MTKPNQGELTMSQPMPEFSRRIDVFVIKDEPAPREKFPSFTDEQYRELVDRHQPYRWRAVAANNEVVAHGESYFNLVDLLDAIELLFGHDTTAYWAPTFGDERPQTPLRYGATDRAGQANDGYTPSGMDEFARREGEQE